MVHRSKKDLWIVLLVAAAVLGPVIAGIARLTASRPATGEALILIAAGLGFGAVLLLLAAPTYYQITPGTLIIKSGVLRHRIPLASIEAIRPTRNPLSAPAWSLDRLRIDYRHGDGMRFALVSPQDKRGFMEEVAGADAGLTADATGVRRAPRD